MHFHACCLILCICLYIIVLLTTSKVSCKLVGVVTKSPAHMCPLILIRAHSLCKMAAANPNQQPPLNPPAPLQIPPRPRMPPRLLAGPAPAAPPGGPLPPRLHLPPEHPPQDGNLGRMIDPNWFKVCCSTECKLLCRYNYVLDL